jgi:DNA-binding CsgD family transcriptional regulator
MSTIASPSFTPRQRQIVQLIAAGHSNDEIGERLGITERTVRAHCEALRLKLGCLRRRHIPLAYARSTGDDPLAAADLI